MIKTETHEELRRDDWEVCERYPNEYWRKLDAKREYLRETRLFQVAPISTNLILSYVAEHVLGLPRSF